MAVNDNGITESKIYNGAVTPAKLSTTGEFTVETMTAETMTANQGANQVGFTASTTNSAQYPAFGFNGQTGDNNGRGAGMYLPADGVIAFSTAGSERMRIDGGGRLLIGTTVADGQGGASFRPNFDDGAARLTFNRATQSNPSSNSVVLKFENNGTTVGQVYYNSSTTTYATSSDYRLKEDIIEMDGSIDRLKALKPCNFRWKSDGTRVDGFIAHEAQEVVPEAVSGTKDAVDEEGNPDYQGIDQAKLVPLLTKALQEAVAKIESLETRVKALENAN